MEKIVRDYAEQSMIGKIK